MKVKYSIQFEIEQEEKEEIQKTYEENNIIVSGRVRDLVRKDVKELREKKEIDRK